MRQLRDEERGAGSSWRIKSELSSLRKPTSREAVFSALRDQRGDSTTQGSHLLWPGGTVRNATLLHRARLWKKIAQHSWEKGD